MSVKIIVANESHLGFAEAISHQMAESAKLRGTGIARRTPEYLQMKMLEGKAVIAIDDLGNWAGFCYIESWENDAYVANSGLIVSPDFRHLGIARKIKKKIFELSALRFPKAKIFGLTTGLAVMKINSDLGYKPVTYSELTTDKEFWKGCTSCVNYAILESKGFKNCLCTAMVFDPNEKKTKTGEKLVKALPVLKKAINKLRK